MGPRLSLGGTDSRFVDSSSSRERAFRWEVFRGGGGSNGSKSVVNTLIKKTILPCGRTILGFEGGFGGGGGVIPGVCEGVGR